jgi:hypothetical protein
MFLIDSLLAGTAASGIDVKESDNDGTKLAFLCRRQALSLSSRNEKGRPFLGAGQCAAG